MQGTGTQADPFYPTNWTEFVEAVGTTEAYVECPVNAEWNMNQMNSNGLKSRLMWHAHRVNGNGTKIKNLYIESGCVYFADDSFTHFVLNLNFLNMWNSEQSEGFFITQRNTRFGRCNISGQIHNGAAFGGDGGFVLTNHGAKSCSINLNFQGGSALFHRNVTFDRCYIVLDGYNGINNGSNGAMYGTLNNCYLTGKLPYKHLHAKTTLGGNVYDIYIPEGHSVGSPSIGALGIINTDKVEGSFGSLIGVTSAQMRDAAYLQSIGFPIIA